MKRPTNTSGPARTDIRDGAVTHAHNVIAQYALAVHGNDVDVGYGNGLEGEEKGEAKATNLPLSLSLPLHLIPGFWTC